MCPFAFEWDLSPERVANVFEQVRQECGMGIVSNLVLVLSSDRKEELLPTDTFIFILYIHAFAVVVRSHEGPKITKSIGR